MQKEFKILSIDFDYFQNVKSDTLIKYYPDSLDLNTELSCFVWASHYANPISEKHLADVTINKTAFSKIKKKIKTNLICPIMIVNSHIHLYDFIKNHIKNNKSKMQIYNIDMHHDMFNTNYETKDGKRRYNKDNMNCGNWGIFVKQKYPNSEIIGIKNKISGNIFKNNLEKPDISTTKFDIINDIDFDMIFICRSDIWLAPHLDSYFDELYQIVLHRYPSVLVDPQVQEPRDISEHTESLRKIYKDYTKIPKEVTSL